MNLRITTPTDVVVDREVTYVQAEDPTGRFGVLPGHERTLTAAVLSVLIYRYREGGAEREAYVAVREGVVRVNPEGVHVAVRQAHAGDDLAGLQREVHEARERRQLRTGRVTRSLYQMQLAAWRRLMEFEDVRAR
jgi:alternate F1F0 ATPase F1 subunit epsilon